MIKKYLHWVPITILGLTLPYKFTGNGLPYLDAFFDGLTGGLGEYVMAGIGLQELLIMFLLYKPSTRNLGVIGAVLTMMGAILTHIYLWEFDAVFAQAWIVLITAGLTYEK